ncbi:MAG: hypothetical protein AB1715_03055, partial [Acidobacteriota bacterium]
KGQIVKLDGDFLFVSGSDEADLPVLIKYRIAEPIGAQQSSEWEPLGMTNRDQLKREGRWR